MARTPLVSCILHGRLSSPSASAVIAYLLRQDYKEIELIVIDDSNQSQDFVSPDPRVRYIHLPSRFSPSEFRNFACGQARGQIMVDCAENWWYAPHHIALLADPLAHDGAHVAVPDCVLFCDSEARTWSLRWQTKKRGSIPAGCVAWRRSWWERNPFHNEPDRDVITFDRARVARVAGPVSAVGFAPPPREMSRAAYEPDRLRAILGRDLQSYWPAEALAPPVVPAAARESNPALPADPPLVSCITPARDLDAAAIAIDLFRAQEYEPKELILIDQSGKLADLLPCDNRYRYLSAEREISMGEARNLGCAEAAGDLIAHWDENDWHSPRRLPALIAALLAADADLCGESSVLLCDVESREGAFLLYPSQAGLHLDGRSLLYRRSVWEEHRFPNTDFREDLGFVRRIHPTKRLALSGVGMRATFGPLCGSPYAHPYPIEEVRRIIGHGWSLFDRERPLKAAPPASKRRKETPVAAVRQAAASFEPPRETVIAPVSISQSFAPPPPPEQTLVSCITPTRDRPEFIRRAVDYFLRQDYPARELLIVDDGSQPVGRLLPPDPRIRYIRLEHPMTVGAKRNLACRQARGDIIVHWDDDDWQSPARIRTQVEALDREDAELCGLGSILVADPQAGRAWRYRCPITERSFYAVGTSFCYRRSLWESVQFADIDIAEDRQFLWNAGQARMVALRDESLVVAILHDRNTTPLNPGGAYWSAVPISEVSRLLGSLWSQDFRPPAVLPPGAPRAVAAAAPKSDSNPLPAPAPRPLRIESNGHRPLVSCIMPTHNRRRFVPLAIQLFLRQDYEPKELVILDDGSDRIEDLIPQDDRFLYIRTIGRMSLGAKRNLGCTVARGEVILHWDDDDWQGSGRIESMTSALLREQVDLCGLNPLYFYDIRSGLAWLYRNPPEARFWVAGTSFCYRREFWERNHFPDVNVGEDNHFIWNSTGGRMIALPETNLQVALLHGGNGSPKAVGDAYWQAHAASDIQWLMGPDFHFYRFEPPLPRLNLGCSDAHVPGMWNVDRAGHPDQIADLRFAWPWAESSVEFIRAHDIIEHLPDRIHTMNEAWRVLEPGGRIEIAVPTTSGPGAFQDPTHVSFWNRRSFLYFEAGNPYRERFAQSYEISAAFRVVFESAQESIDGERLTIVLEAVK